MIPTYELETVHDFLNESNEGSLETNFKLFIKKFQSDALNLFNPTYLLLQALCDNVLVLTKGQRLLAAYIIIESFKNEPPKSHPFILTMLDICDQSQDNFEKKFFYDLIIKKGKEQVSFFCIFKFIEQYGYMSLKSLLEEQEKYFDSFRSQEELESFRKSLLDQIAPYHIPFTAQNQLRNVVPDSIQIDKKNDPPKVLPSFGKMKNIHKEFVGFEVDMLRPMPECIGIFDRDEANWLDVGIFVDVQWDYNIAINNDTLSLVKELMQKAYQNQLTNEEINTLQDLFQKDQNMIENCGFSPAHLPELVEKNSSLASFVLIKMHHQDNIHEYFDKLGHLEVSLATLEVVNKLASNMVLPKEFLNYFITQCIQQCEQQQSKDKSTLNRLVRLVSVFIRAMIKHKNLNPKELYIEVTRLQAFCIEFSKISEASALFKILKQIDHDKDKTPG